MNRNERGSVAVVASVSMLMLFSLAAVAVDLGNAFTRKRDLQSQADFAALAGADGLGESNSYLASDPAVIAVANYLNNNQPQDDDGFVTVQPTHLVDDADHTQDGDAEEANGEVYFLSGNKMRVVTPLALVEFGIADAIGFNNVSVASQATVQIRSGGGVMPFYAVDGCDFGPQTMSDPPPGHTDDLTLAFEGDNGQANLASINPSQVALNESPAPAMTITGSNFTGGSADASEVGFFRDGGAAPVVVNTFTSLTDTEIRIAAIPSAVLSVEEVWWVRVYKHNAWSPVDEALPLTVGGSVLECVGSATDGNFGSLTLPRYDSNNSSGDGWLPINIAKGLEEPLTLKPHAGATPPDYTCVDGVNLAIVSDTSPPDLKPDTNCVDTDTGLPSTAATAGFITGGSGAGGFTGRLDEETTPGCGANLGDRNARWDTGIDVPGPGSDTYKINDDLLTCFFTSDATTIGTISQENYTGGAVISPKIYESPRFFWQPVLKIDPTSGGSDRYSIIEFRPGFITDQPLGANRVNSWQGTATHNGFHINNNNIERIKVVFFNIGALPPPDENSPTVAYMGFGPKVIRLVD